MMDLDLRYVRINQLLARMHEVSVEDHIGRTLREVVPSPEADTLEPVIRKVIETGEPLLNFELCNDQPDPEHRRWWLSSYRPLESESGEVVGASGVVQEITDLKRAERVDGEILLRIEDDGIGFEPAAVKNKVGVGLASMEERARLIHGELTIRAESGRGASISVRVPLTEATL